MGGLSTNTPSYLLLAAGAYVKVGSTDIGALMGEITWSTRREVYHPDLFSSKGNIKGTGHVTKETAQLTFTMTEFEYAKLAAALVGMNPNSDANSEMIGAGTVGKMADAEYPSIEVLGMNRHDSKVVEIKLDQAFLANDPEIVLSDREDSTIELTFEAVYLANTATTRPWLVKIDKG